MKINCFFLKNDLGYHVFVKKRAVLCEWMFSLHLKKRGVPCIFLQIFVRMRARTCLT